MNKIKQSKRESEQNSILKEQDNNIKANPFYIEEEKKPFSEFRKENEFTKQKEEHIKKVDFNQIDDDEPEYNEKDLDCN
jgi:hypothetical protein